MGNVGAERDVSSCCSVIRLRGAQEFRYIVDLSNMSTNPSRHRVLPPLDGDAVLASAQSVASMFPLYAF